MDYKSRTRPLDNSLDLHVLSTGIWIVSLFWKNTTLSRVEIFPKTRQGFSLMSHLVHVPLFTNKKITRLT